jgi:hypothetical protein
MNECLGKQFNWDVDSIMFGETMWMEDIQLGSFTHILVT